MESYVEQWKREKREREEAEKKAAAQKESQKEEVKNGKNKRSCGLEAEETGSGGEQTVRQQPDNKTD